MRLAYRLTFALAASVIVAGCGATSRTNNADFGNLGNFDLTGVDPNADLSALGHDMAHTPCDDATNPCPNKLRCFAGQCIADDGTCSVDNDCQNDSYCVCTGGGGGDAGACMGGVCVPYGTGPRGSFDPDCQSQGFSASQFVAPKVKCSWAGAGTLVTPIVGDLDGDGKSEIVFQSYGVGTGGFTALHQDCSVYFNKTFGFAASNQSQLAIADLDGDKIPEIIGMDSANRVVVFDNKGNLLATAPTASSTNASQNWGGLSIADMDNVAPPEIIAGGQVSRFIKGTPSTIKVLFTNAPPSTGFGLIPIVADLDGDGKPELIVGLQVYDGITGADKTPSALKAAAGPPAFPAIADFNNDKKPDIVLVQSSYGDGRVSIFDYANNKFIFGPFALPGGGGGPPTVADFDGDGQPEFATAGPDNYFVFDPECLAATKPAKCDQTSSIGILWKKKTQDHSSGATGSSVFDFNGDGKAEVVYRDECFLRVYDGLTGKTLFATPVSSATALELPVIADLDGDGHAEIVVCADNYIGSGCAGQTEIDTGVKFVSDISGMFVYQDPMNRWMPSRAVWNEHGYHITNINDDLTVPTVEKDNWLTFNNYRQNVQGAMTGTPAPQVDLTSAESISIDNGGMDCSVAERLWAMTCNRGTAVAAAGEAGTFYTADPRTTGAKKICTATTMKALNPGECEAVYCDWPTPPSGPQDLWFRTNDDGTGAQATGECKLQNDLLFMPSVQCYIPG